MNVVEVQWLDSVSEGRWHAKDDVIREATYDAMLHRSVGFLVHETEELILLAGSRGENGVMVADTMQIPRSAILHIRKLRSA